MADPTTSPASGGLPFVARIVGGIVVVAVIVGIGLWAESRTDDDLALPDRVAGLAEAPDELARELVGPHSKGVAELYDADAAATLYGTEPDSQVLVTAVRAESGPLAPAVFTEEQDWVEDDDVACLVTHQRKGPDSVICQRGDGDLTVQLFNLGSDLDVDTIVDATNDVWDEVS